MEIYVARQPIFNKSKKIYGYELLFRTSMSNFFPEIDGNIATSKLLSNSFFSIGIETITGPKKAFINFTQDLLLQRVPLMFPHDRIVVEILEDVKPREDVVEACREIAKAGYAIALDDFIYAQERVPLIALADIIKIDLRVTPLADIDELVKKLPRNGVTLLAEKVETYEEFKSALEMGFSYFQGYFFSKPEILKGKELSTHQIQLLEIMAEANRKDVHFDKLEKHIIQDLSVSYKLLRMINSAYFRRINEVSSIKQAIIMIGETGIRRFLSLIAMAGLVSGKPDELIKVSIIRAKFCELIGDASDSQVDASELFTMGLFSLIDAMMDDSMESLLEKLPLSNNIKSALIHGKGKLGNYLKLAEYYEKGEWKLVSKTAARLSSDEKKLPHHYMEAVSWADGLNC
ncbi:MAG: EAL domain-containing protein [Desulfobacterales bacterium]|uniref:EAL domain-containing protein n=1 Tax=Candidatus Desulfatibia vada TaxID=2841696 RepID=A0A8J6P0I9_9BACT|nr:EAL domain-containing protein [Candidatus Desulfatibia vada]MBL6971177.1 EAL domain-containing protein [Desulfobacterales bacterium]